LHFWPRLDSRRLLADGLAKRAKQPKTHANTNDQVLHSTPSQMDNACRFFVSDVESMRKSGPDAKNTDAEFNSVCILSRFETRKPICSLPADLASRFIHCPAVAVFAAFEIRGCGYSPVPFRSRLLQAAAVIRGLAGRNDHLRQPSSGLRPQTRGRPIIYRRRASRMIANRLPVAVTWTRSLLPCHRSGFVADVEMFVVCVTEIEYWSYRPIRHVPRSARPGVVPIGPVRDRSPNGNHPP
jgi:hypothetical protein